MNSAHLFVPAFGIMAILAPLVLGKPPGIPDPGDALIVVPDASSVEREHANQWFRSGCQSLKYDVAAPFPGSNIVSFISEELERRGWARRNEADEGSSSASKHAAKRGDWRHCKNAAGGKTYLRTDDWEDQFGDRVTYRYWYFSPSMRILQIDAEYMSADAIHRHRCVPSARAHYDATMYAVSVQIAKVEPVGRDFRVSVLIENAGAKPILLGVEGDRSDGSPELWVLGVEQQGSDGQWYSVDAVCTEHPAFDWIELKPGDKLNSWEMAVEFPELDYRFGMCRRHVAHLGGRVRVAIRYYLDACDIENPLGNQTPHFAVSAPLNLPVRGAESE